MAALYLIRNRKPNESGIYLQHAAPVFVPPGSPARWHLNGNCACPPDFAGPGQLPRNERLNGVTCDLIAPGILLECDPNERRAARRATRRKAKP